MAGKILRKIEKIKYLPNQTFFQKILENRPLMDFGVDHFMFLKFEKRPTLKEVTNFEEKNLKLQ